MDMLAEADAEASPQGTEEPRCTIALVLSLAPHSLVETSLELPVGATVADAMAQAHALVPEPTLWHVFEWSVWGRRALPSQVLQQGDRLEGTRALRVDPKMARRERFAHQGARTTGLFSKRQQNRLRGEVADPVQPLKADAEAGS